MPTTITREKGLWLVHGPWGQRAFVLLPSAPPPHDVLARELGILEDVPEHLIETLLRSRSWDAAARRWVEDPAPETPRP